MSEVDYYKNYSQTQSLQYGFSKADLDRGIEYFNTHFLPHLPQDKSINILEIGCGWGKFIKAMTKAGYTNVAGVDISSEQIEIAKKFTKVENVFLIDAFEYLKKQSGKLDIVILSDVLEHLENEYAIKLFMEIKKQLNENGKIIVQVPNGMSLLNPIRYADITHVQAFIPQSLNQIFRLSGFSKVDCFEVPPKGKNLKKKIRLILWKILVKPIISAYMLIANGDKMGGIYTSNIIAVAAKEG